MRYLIPAVALAMALVYFVFYASRIPDPAFWAVIGVGLVLMLASAWRDLRADG